MHIFALHLGDATLRTRRASRQDQTTSLSQTTLDSKCRRVKGPERTSVGMGQDVRNMTFVSRQG